MKPKLLIVGAFPFMRNDFNENAIYGGILKSSEIIFNSDIFQGYEIIPLDSTQISNPPPGLFVRSVYSIKRIFNILYQLSLKKPDATLIFASDGLSAIEKGLMIWFCQLFSCPSLIFPRAGNLINQISKSFFMLQTIKFLFGKATIFLCQGQKWSDIAISKLNFDASKVEVINNWTATNELIAIGEQRQYNDSQDIPRLLFVGWLEDFKGIFELLNVCKNLYNSDIKFHLTIAGNGSAESLAKQFVEDHKISSCITFLGWTDSASLASALKENNIFVLPSWSEGLPNAMIEAMAAGLATIVTSVGLIPDYIGHHEHALLISPKDIDSLEIAIRELIYNQKLRVDLAKNGHDLVKEKFASDVSLQQLSKLIERVIAKT